MAIDTGDLFACSAIMQRICIGQCLSQYIIWQNSSASPIPLIITQRPKKIESLKVLADGNHFQQQLRLCHIIQLLQVIRLQHNLLHLSSVNETDKIIYTGKVEKVVTCVKMAALKKTFLSQLAQAETLVPALAPALVGAMLPPAEC